MKYLLFTLVVITTFLPATNLFAQCPESIQKLNSRKIKYVYDDVSEEPLNISYLYTEYDLDRSGNSDNFFSENFLSNLPDHASVITFNYNNTSETCVFDASGQRSVAAPVELSLFIGKLSGEDAELHWITEIEVNNEFFEVQQSFDGRAFETIAIVNGAGDSDTPTGYHFSDFGIKSRAEQATAYYRLRQVDFDGTSSYSGVIAIDIDIDKDEFKITRVSGWKNNGGSIKVYFTSNAQTKQVYSILGDMSGRILDQRTLYPEEGLNNFDINITNIKSPVYFLSINNGRSIVSEKIALASGY